MSKAASNRPAESEKELALLSWIQQYAPYGVMTLDKKFHIQSWNHWMEIHSGRPAKEVIGKDLFALFPDLHERKLTSAFERALQGESTVLATALHHYLLRLPSPFRETGFEYMFQTARLAPLLLADQTVCGVVLVIEDVTQRESQAEIIRRRLRRDELLAWALAHLLKTEQPRNTVRQLFFKVAEYLDFDSFFLYLRDPESAALNLYAIGGVPAASENDFFACPFITLVPPESHEILLLASVQKHAEPAYKVLKKAGVSAAVAIPLFAEGRNLGLLCFTTWSRESVPTEESDLLTTIGQYLATALDREQSRQLLQKAKEQLSEHAQLLEGKVLERTSRLQETISELETFSYTLAHDLKAPVRGMTGFCDVLLEDFGRELSSGATQVVKKLSRASKRMETLTRDLLEFSKISRQDVILESVKIEPLIEDVIALRLPYIREAITIKEPLHSVRAQKALLQQVLSNLIDNAVKFVEPGVRPKITICTEAVGRRSPNTRPGPLLFSSSDFKASPTEAAAGSQRQQIRIWIEDEGIGIPHEAHQKIFGIFERGVSAPAYEGTGIGLAIVARAMQRMGGTCGVESEPGKGSKFWIELPEA